MHCVVTTISNAQLTHGFSATATTTRTATRSTDQFKIYKSTTAPCSDRKTPSVELNNKNTSKNTPKTAVKCTNMSLVYNISKIFNVSLMLHQQLTKWPYFWCEPQGNVWERDEIWNLGRHLEKGKNLHFKIVEIFVLGW